MTIKSTLDDDLMLNHSNHFNNLNPELRENCINLFYNFFKEVPTFAESLRPEIEGDRFSWWAVAGWHFHQGMWFRNYMRDNGFTDNKMGCNLDDVYIPLMEKALQRIYPDLELGW